MEGDPASERLQLMRNEPKQARRAIEQRRADIEQRNWQDERDAELAAPDVYPDPEPESNYTPDQS